jgi:hypothetical protein
VLWLATASLVAQEPAQEPVPPQGPRVPFGASHQGYVPSNPALPPQPPADLNAFPPPGAPGAPYMVQNIGNEPGNQNVPSTMCGFFHIVDEYAPPCPYIWFSTEALYWWVKDAPLPLPVVTTSTTPLAPLAGAIGGPGTQVLFGNTPQSFGGLNGGRATLGAWFDYERLLGLEVSAFGFERGATSFFVNSPTPGAPPLYVPRFNVLTGTEGGYVVSSPLFGNQGNIRFTSDTQLWGAEFNGYGGLARCCWCNVDMLLGFRYLDLQENMYLNTSFLIPAVGTGITTEDRFRTRNHFYGGQLGAKACFFWGPVSLDVIGKCALGETREIVNVQGSSTTNIVAPGFPAPGTYPGGIFSQRTNIGNQERDLFTVVPSAQMKLSVYVTRCVRATAGYDILYWNQVVRPGNQIDRGVNNSQFLGGPLVGPARPTPVFRTSDYFIHGVSGGIEFTF